MQVTSRNIDSEKICNRLALKRVCLHQYPAAEITWYADTCHWLVILSRIVSLRVIYLVQPLGGRFTWSPYQTDSWARRQTDIQTETG